MIRTGDEYRESLRDGRAVWIDGGWVEDVPAHPAFKPIVDARARIYDLAHEEPTQTVMSYIDSETGDRCPVGAKPPLTKEDWHAKRIAVDTVLDDLRGIVTRVGDETVGEMWSLYDGQDVLNEINPAFSEHIRHHIRHAAMADPFHVSANTDPKGDRSLSPQEQDPDVLLHVIRETDNGIVVRGAKFETAAAYANQAFVKPTIGDWGDAVLSDYAVGFVADMAAPGVKHICRSTFAGRESSADYPLTNRFDEIDTMIVFDDVEIPWENVFFYRHTRAAAFIRATLHRYSMFPFVQRHLRFADLLVGVAYTNAVQTGVRMHQGVREKLAELVCYREGINAHLSAAIEFAQQSPGGLMMPNQPLLFTGRVLACSQLPAMMHLARDLCGGQLCITPSAEAFAAPDTGPLLHKYLAVGSVDAEERRKLFAFARDLLNSDYAGHRLTFQLFAQSPAFAHLLAVYNNYDFAGPADLVRRYAGLSADGATDDGPPDDPAGIPQAAAR
jgi:4-hydroxyphenylacetate 3-monooxygenase